MSFNTLNLSNQTFASFYKISKKMYLGINMT